MNELDRQAIYRELEATKVTFQRLVDGMTQDDLNRVTNGTKWANREMLFHMLFGYLVVRALIPLVKAFGVLPRPVSNLFAATLNAGTVPFHAINYFGSRSAGRRLSPSAMARWLDRVCDKLSRRLAKESDRSLSRGMHFPTRWDPFFKDYMTLREVYHYPTQHFEFHQRQLNYERLPGDTQDGLAP